MNLAESTVEEAALSWLSELGFAAKHGPEIAPGELHAERIGFGETMLAKRLRDAQATSENRIALPVAIAIVLVKSFTKRG